MARGATRSRPSGWCDWWIADNLGCALSHPDVTVRGMESSKAKAQAMAAEAARQFNRLYDPPAPTVVPKSEIKPSCDRRDVTEHGRIAA